jgi:hypothetical protein
MLRTTVVGSWPPEERYRSPLALYFRGQMDEPESESLLKEIAAVAIVWPSAAAPSNKRWPKSPPWSQRRDRSDVRVRTDAASATSHVAYA